LAKAAKTSTHLLNYLKKDLSANQPGENFWIILEEIINKEFNIDEFNSVLDTFLNWIVQIAKEDESDAQTFILFERFIKTTIKISFDEAIASKLIKIYFDLENRNILLS
jgi:hypothetical protein